MEYFDLMSAVAILNTTPSFKRSKYFSTDEGKDFLKSLRLEAEVPEHKEQIEGFFKSWGIKDEVIEKGVISLPDIMDYRPQSLEVPVDRSGEMFDYPDKRLNSDAVLRAIGSQVVQPQQYWTKQSDLCYMFKASPESIEAALLGHVDDGRVAFEKLSKEMIFARTV